MKKLIMTLALVCVLSGSIFAGNMLTVGVVDPPTPGETSTPPGETQTPPGDTQGPNLVTAILLAIINWP